MLPYRDTRVTQIALVIFFLLVAGYAFFEGRALIFGPKIIISSQSSTVSEQYVIISGQVEHIDTLTVDGEPVPVTENGGFSVPYLLAVGDNRIMLDARDSYGNTSHKVIEIVFNPPASSTVSTSTPGITTLPKNAAALSAFAAQTATSTQSGATSSAYSTTSGQTSSVAGGR